MSKIRVADFFCGAGGFSEGFRQMGFDVTFALDSWKPAIDTHEFNHPGCEHSQKNILDIPPEEIEELIPDSEVIVGSPPCIAFSGSNKAGIGDKTLGMLLIEKYLQIIAYKKNKPDSVLKHWVLENVPNAQKFIKDKYSFKELELCNSKRVALRVPMSNVYNAADFGAPQTRRRMFCGDYPEPKTTHTKDEWVTLGSVIGSLRGGKKSYTDIGYGFSIPKRHVTDHFYDTMLEEFEWSEARRLKIDHGFMGKMSFPENEDRPSRTVMATMSSSTRESMILPGKTEGTFRRPTIREIASFMSFPLTYQFIAGSEAGKYKLVGNAVCVKMSAALARSMLENQGLEPDYEPNPHNAFKKPPFDLNGMERVPKKPGPRRINARFRRHPEGLKIRSFRVELDNQDSDFKKEKVVWKAILHYGSGKGAKKSEISNKKLEKMMMLVPDFDRFKDDVMKAFVGTMPSSKDFQLSYRRLADGDMIGPVKALGMVKELVDSHYPEDAYSGKEVHGQNIIEGRKAVPLRVMASLFAVNVLSSAVMATYS